MTGQRLGRDEVQKFLTGNTLECFSPASGLREAMIEYRPNGTCIAKFENGDTDEGTYHFDGDLYVTQYTRFREGTVNRFFLERIDGTTCQAFYDDGTKAFLQSIKKSSP